MLVSYLVAVGTAIADPSPCGAHPVLAGHGLLQEFLHQRVDAGITFGGVNLRFTDQVCRKMKGEIACIQCQNNTCTT